MGDVSPDIFYKLLGYNGETFLVWSVRAKQVIELTAKELSIHANLMRFASKTYWEKEYPNKSATDWEGITSEIIELSYAIGVFNPLNIRGRGVWLDEGRTVLHLGQVLVVDDVRYEIGGFDTNYIYEAHPTLDLYQSDKVATTSEAKQFLAICQSLKWERPINAYLFAGWCMIAPICGALQWRPHIWLTGEQGSGKTWVMDNVARRMTGDIALYTQGNTTEAGLRQSLQRDARPVLLDEAEGRDSFAERKVKGILELARQASSESGGQIVKGTSGGKAQVYSIQSCFMFASISIGIEETADASRISVLSLVKANGASKAEDLSNFKELEERVSKTLTPEYAMKLRGRAIKLLTIIRHNATIFADAIALHLPGGRRTGDQLGTLLAGAYALHRNNQLTLKEAEAWILKRDWSEHTPEDCEKDERLLLKHLMETPLRFDGINELSIGELIERYCSDETTTVMENIKLTLRRIGMDIDLEKEVVCISCNHSAIKKILNNTRWHSNWGRILERIPKTKIVPQYHFGVGSKSKMVEIPIQEV